jgi:AAA domain
VDEAQNLGETVLENLRLLSNIETATEKLLQIILVGQPELERKLAHPNLRQLKQRIAVQCRLDKLKEREVGPFIFSRLRTSGYEKKDLFPPETIQRIALYSRGTPRLINILCDNALLVAYSAAQQVISPDMVDEVARDLQMRSEVGPREERNVQYVIRRDGESNPREKTQDLNFGNDVATGKAVAPSVQTAPPVVQTWRPLPSPRGAFFYIGIGALLAVLLLPALGIKLENAVDILRGALISWTHFGSQNTANPTTPKEVNPHAPLQPPINAPPQAVPLPTPADALAEQPRPATQGLEETRDTKEFEQQANAGGPDSGVRAGSPLENKKEQQNSFVIVQSGTTISMIVQKTYGSLTPLAVDLVKEFNPTVQNLDQIHAGEKIWLPPLTRETLLRKEADGSSRLIVGSFRSLSEAEKFQQKVKDHGFTVKVSPQKISARIFLYRVEIEGLQELAAIDRAWDLVDSRGVSAEP